MTISNKGKRKRSLISFSGIFGWGPGTWHNVIGFFIESTLLFLDWAYDVKMKQRSTAEINLHPTFACWKSATSASHALLAVLVLVLQFCCKLSPSLIPHNSLSFSLCKPAKPRLSSLMWKKFMLFSCYFFPVFVRILLLVEKQYAFILLGLYA